MGFDIYGLEPKNEKGKYFRNNVWWWRPLAEYVLKNIKVPAQEKMYWESNDGQKVSEETAVKISNELKCLISSGHCKMFEKEFKEKKKEMKKVKCKYCIGQKEKRCVICNGTKKTESILTWYDFSVENVEEFAEFCENSGGFEIW